LNQVQQDKLGGGRLDKRKPEEQGGQNRKRPRFITRAEEDAAKALEEARKEALEQARKDAQEAHEAENQSMKKKHDEYMQELEGGVGGKGPGPGPAGVGAGTGTGEEELRWEEVPFSIGSGHSLNLEDPFFEEARKVCLDRKERVRHFPDPMAVRRVRIWAGEDLNSRDADPDIDAALPAWADTHRPFSLWKDPVRT